MQRRVRDLIPDSVIITRNHVSCHNKMPRFFKPLTFNEKIYHIKMGSWLLDKSKYVDKYAVRDYVRQTLGEQYLPELYAVYQTAEEFDLSVLPTSFVLKLNNGSGSNLVVVDKSKVSEDDIKLLIQKWLNSNFYKNWREKQYKRVNQCVICEQYLEDSSGALRDYKIFCSNKKAIFTQVDTQRATDHIQTFYDTSWNKLDVTYASQAVDTVEKCPQRYDEMLQLAEKIAVSFPFVRVDFYEVEGRIYFGEITFTPNNGMIAFKPYEKEVEFGKLIDLTQYK